jgi:hypothetical protein
MYTRKGGLAHTNKRIMHCLSSTPQQTGPQVPVEEESLLLSLVFDEKFWAQVQREAVAALRGEVPVCLHGQWRCAFSSEGGMYLAHLTSSSNGLF